MPERSTSLQAPKAAPGVEEQSPGVPLAASAGQAVPAPQGASAPDLSALAPPQSFATRLTPRQQQLLAALPLPPRVAAGLDPAVPARLLGVADGLRPAVAARIVEEGCRLARQEALEQHLGRLPFTPVHFSDDMSLNMQEKQLRIDYLKRLAVVVTEAIKIRPGVEVHGEFTLEEPSRGGWDSLDRCKGLVVHFPGDPASAFPKSHDWGVELAFRTYNERRREHIFSLELYNEAEKISVTKDDWDGESSAIQIGVGMAAFIHERLPEIREESLEDATFEDDSLVEPA